MSNPFAALDDSGDEAPKAPKTKAVAKDTKKKVVEASKPDPRNTHDRNTKHGRGGRPPPRDGKREFDRRSGTGRGKEIKKGGGGARNWGSDKNEAKKMEGRINENEVVATKKEGGDEESKPTDSPKEAEPEKVVDNTISYSDYVASKGKKEEVAQREIENAFKGVTVAVSVEESFMVMGGAKQKKIKKKKDAEKKTIDVGFRVTSSNTEESSRGGDRGRDESRGGGRGGRGRGGRGRGEGRGRGGRGGRGSSKGPSSSNKKPSGINVQDENAFPSL
ncbi:hypothetical protein FRACYDRAFT_267303 [Fragilariopsis cylindrus CCMP1102]|uniref:Hyaluronan/mRNA-binding protein domain-containing protein n=1 Tax=Fragilariopsis cylindrus CCMP1102 TaxID=635003 RepID=A0A1E7FWJ6_9STRA|nr:hypothetical protein FRACYDRAFT_267303 [Fragilariopsis cylindrus CCMP1102]|eukprot:OEU22522.1 hypothetical protein FRACYDRAFT_267303 [Fragilariopsis cylindrus CCMP1102]